MKRTKMISQTLYTNKRMAVVAGTVTAGAYILGHTRGERRGYMRGITQGVAEGLDAGRIEGYVRAISDYATLLRNASSTEKGGE